jgi:hypothetical protein
VVERRSVHRRAHQLSDDSYQKLAAVLGTTVSRSTFEGWATAAASVPTAIQVAAKKKRALGRFKADEARNAIQRGFKGTHFPSSITAFARSSRASRKPT